MMEVWRHAIEAAPAAGPFVVTLGTFDGVHAGHRELLRVAAGRARAQGHRAAVGTFDPHPTVVVAPATCPCAKPVTRPVMPVASDQIRKPTPYTQ